VCSMMQLPPATSTIADVHGAAGRRHLAVASTVAWRRPATRGVREAQRVALLPQVLSRLVFRTMSGVSKRRTWEYPITYGGTQLYMHGLQYLNVYICMVSCIRLHAHHTTQGGPSSFLKCWFYARVLRGQQMPSPRPWKITRHFHFTVRNLS
jgi:hypothetical protein